MPLSDHAVALMQGDLWAGDANADVGAPTDEGISNIDQGFDASFTTSVPPTRELFNGILRQHSALARALVTGVLNWDTRLTYPAGALVLGSDDAIYVSQTSNKGNDPTSDDGTNWEGLLTDYAKTTGAQSFKDAVTIEKSVLLKHQGSDPDAPTNANDILLYAASNILKARSTTFNSTVVLEGTDPNLGVLNLAPQASAPANPAANNRKLYVNSSGTLFTLNSDGNAHRILVQNEVTNISPSGYIELTNRASVVSPAATKIRLFAKDKLLLYEDDGGTRTVATRSWVNTQLSSMSSTIADGSITHDKLAADAVETDNIKDGAVTGAKIAGTTIASGKLANNAVTSAKIATGAVTHVKLAAGAVETDNIKNGAVTNAKLENLSVGTDKIKNGHITNVKLANDAVTSSKIADGAVIAAAISDGAVGHDKLAADAVESDNIKDGAITAAKLAGGVSTGGGGTIADGSITHAKLAANAVESENIKNGNVTHAKLAADAVETDNIKNGNVTNAKLAANAVVTANIANGAVTTAKIPNSAITHVKLAANAVESDNIKNANVTHNKLANNAVESDNVKNGAITHTKLASDAVESDNVKNGAITHTKLASDAVESDNIKDGAITAAKLASDVMTGGGGGTIADGSITHAKLAADAVELDNIKDRAVNTVKLALQSVASSNLRDGHVTHVKMAADAIESDNIKDGAVTVDKIASGAITHVKMAADAIDSDNIKTGAITGAKIASATITHAKLANGAVTNAKILNGSVTNAKMASNAIVTANIADGAVTTAKIPDGAITAAKLASGVGGVGVIRTHIAQWTSPNHPSQNWTTRSISSTYTAVGSTAGELIIKGQSLTNFIAYQLEVVTNTNKKKAVYNFGGTLHDPITWQDREGSVIRRVRITSKAASVNNAWLSVIHVNWTYGQREGYIVNLYLLTL